MFTYFGLAKMKTNDLERGLVSTQCRYRYVNDRRVFLS